MILRFKPSKGIAPRISPYELDDDSAQTANNCMFGSGSVRPLVAGLSVSLNVNDQIATPPKSWFRYTGDRWCSWTADVDVCRSMVADISGYTSAGGDRLYWTDPNAGFYPRMAGNTSILNGSVAKPGQSYRLGIPKPASPPVASGATGSSSEKLKRAYVYTYVSTFGEEGPPSDPSNIIEVDPGAAVTLSGMSVAPTVDSYGNAATGYTIASKRIYRTNTGSGSTEYQYVGIVAVGSQLTTPEIILDADLGEVCPSSTWFEPPSNMIGLTAHPAGFLVGYYNTPAAGILCFSAPYLPHAWVKQIVVDSPIVAIGMFGTSAIVTTTGFPMALTGSDPTSMTVERMETGEACVLKRGFIDMGYLCIYPGVSGLWAAGTGGVKLVTEDIITRTEWDASFSHAASNPLQFAAQYDHLYIGFQSVGGFVFNTITGDFYTHSINADSAYTDHATGGLFYHVNGESVLRKWGTNVAQSLTWKSKKVRLKAPLNFSACQVFASGTMDVKIYADGVLKLTKTAANSAPFRLPSGYRATEWEVQVEGVYEITSIALASSISELSQI